MGHSRAGGLRPTAAAVLSTDRRVPHMLFAGQPCFLRECSGQVVSRSAAPLSVDPDHPGGHQAGPARRQGHHRDLEGQETGTHHLPAGPHHVEGDQRGEVPGVLGADAEGTEDRVRRGHPRRAVSRAASQATSEVRLALTPVADSVDIQVRQCEQLAPIATRCRLDVSLVTYAVHNSTLKHTFINSQIRIINCLTFVGWCE